MWKHFLKDYFAFTRKERGGIIFIVSIIMGLLLLSYSFPFFTRQKIYSHQEFDHEIALLTTVTKDSSKNKKYIKYADPEFHNDNSLDDRKKYDYVKAETFDFDPNTISSADWKRLGVKEKTITTIQKYLSKGGRFNKPGDLARIWGLSPVDQQRLIPYVSIKTTTRETAPFENVKYAKTPSSYASKKDQQIDVNLADTTGYISRFIKPATF